ncbi:hypothetical protein BDZ89DRAFT_1160276 [Hymenopellis radicata]|nr:hypothetical protein BDZ89DRAFT_1160276 [Hymenopellis radicata]
MPLRPIRDSRKDLSLQKSSASAIHPCNHGLDTLPSENLTHITSHLDPFDLYAFARVCSAFNAHVADEHTWRSAFLLNFFGIDSIEPESDKRTLKSLLLRRSESTWKKEYVVRYNLRRRWERSRTSTVAHAPVASKISKIHVLPTNALLASSLVFGIVARSVPLTGKIVRGNLSPSNLGTGIFLGNPNAEFVHDVTTCDITSDGGTAKIAWGFNSGRVAAMTVAKAMDVTSKSAGKLVNCVVGDQHDGPVNDIVWDDRVGCILSAGRDGLVKLWDAKTLHHIIAWGDPQAGTPCVKLSAALTSGLFAVGMSNGDIVVRTGIQRDEHGAIASIIVEHTIACPLESPPGDASAFPVISAIRIDTQTATDVSLLVTYENHPHFYRVDITGESQEITRFGDSSCGSITAVYACFAVKPGEASFILVGDDFGWISVYPWTLHSALPIKRFEANQGCFGISSIAYNNVTLVAGYKNGVVDAFDASTFQRIRSFSALEFRPGGPPRPISDIVLNSNKDVLIVSAGDQIMAWEAGFVKHSGRGGVRGRHSGGKMRAKTAVNTKGYTQLELKNSINESLHLMKHEQEYNRRAHSRARRQNANLEELGLSEAEAIDYLLMVSRDEALEREGQSSHQTEDGIFDLDFDGAPSSSRSSHSSNSEYSTSQASGTPPEHLDALVSSLHSESHFPAIPRSLSTNSPASAWSRGGSSWGGRSTGTSISGSTGIAALSGRQQEEEDLRLAIELSLREV